MYANVNGNDYFQSMLLLFEKAKKSYIEKITHKFTSVRKLKMRVDRSTATLRDETVYHPGAMCGIHRYTGRFSQTEFS